MTDDIDYDQLIQEMREENERQVAEWQREALEQFDRRSHFEKYENTSKGLLYLERNHSIRKLFTGRRQAT